MNASSLELLCVTGFSNADGYPCRLMIDEYVAFRFRTYDKALGSGHLRLVNNSTRILEIVVEPRTQVVRGVTLTAFDGFSPWPELSIVTIKQGLPAVSTTFETYEVISLQEDFRVAVHERDVLIYWGELRDCEAYAFGGARFLVRDSVLRGVMFVGLSEDELRTVIYNASKGAL